MRPVTWTTVTFDGMVILFTRCPHCTMTNGCTKGDVPDRRCSYCDKNMWVDRTGRKQKTFYRATGGDKPTGPPRNS